MSRTTGTSYAELPDFDRWGLPRNSIPQVTDAMLAVQLEASSRFVDSALARFQPPLVSWGNDIVQAVCIHAAWTLARSQGLMHPSYRDPALDDRYQKTCYDPNGLSWLQRVAKGEFTPSFAEDASPDDPEAGALSWSDSELGWTPAGGTIP